MSRTSTTVIAALSGLAVGAALGILLAPASGKETRAKLMKNGSKLRDGLSDLAEKAMNKAKGTVASEADGHARGRHSTATS